MLISIANAELKTKNRFCLKLLYNSDNMTFNFNRDYTPNSHGLRKCEDKTEDLRYKLVITCIKHTVSRTGAVIKEKI